MTPTWRVLRDDARRRLEAAAVDDPDQEVRWMLEQASGRTSAELVSRLDDRPEPRQAGHLAAMVERREGGEPLQYVLGRWGFRTLDLLVDRRVLIPRPETEVVAGLALAALEALGRPATAVDLGTGSGAIALSLAAERWPHIEVWATDASADALAVARANLAGLGRRSAVVRLVEGDWYDALPTHLRGSVDLVVSNPPYVATSEALPSAVDCWEPAAALRAGADGLDDLRRIVGEAPAWLVPGGVLVTEIGEAQGPAVLELAQRAGLADARLERDLAGRHRALVARR